MTCAKCHKRITHDISFIKPTQGDQCPHWIACLTWRQVNSPLWVICLVSGFPRKGRIFHVEIHPTPSPWIPVRNKRQQFGMFFPLWRIVLSDVKSCRKRLAHLKSLVSTENWFNLSCLICCDLILWTSFDLILFNMITHIKCTQF